MADYNEAIKNLQTVHGMPMTIRLAIEALEKQIPKKVCTITNRFNVTHYHCPRRECHAELEYENQRYCDDCGQALNWEGIERK